MSRFAWMQILASWRSEAEGATELLCAAKVSSAGLAGEGKGLVFSGEMQACCCCSYHLLLADRQPEQDLLSPYNGAACHCPLLPLPAARI